MPTVRKATIVYTKASVAGKAKSHSNDSYVIRKVAQAKEIMSKVKLPDHLRSSNL